MQLINLAHPKQTVSFQQALKQGQGVNRGLFFPPNIPSLENIDALLDGDFLAICQRVLEPFVGDEIPEEPLGELLQQAFTFTPRLVATSDGSHALELFHGPSLAFKDFGARFMAQCLHFFGDEECTILTATSGDTGAAVAHAFHRVPNIDVVVLYPQNGVTPLQEKLFCTLGDNIRTFAVDDDFDTCQALVKRSFEDDNIRRTLRLNSANSINIARLLAQVCYYFEAAARIPGNDKLVFSVPSGNFGNITAGAIAKAMGLPIKRLIAATNINDTVPRFFQTGSWDPNPTVATLSNAMDISAPNNYVRLARLIEQQHWSIGEDVVAVAIDDETTTQAMQKLFADGYLAEPHTALAHHALLAQQDRGESGVFLGTAHPAKFLERVEQATGHQTPLPPVLAEHAQREVLSTKISGDYQEFRETLLS